MKTKIYITIDTEFSIAGAFANEAYNPLYREPVYCDVNGKSEGLGFLIETFEQYQVPATFFVEPLNHHYFGDEPMGTVANTLHQKGFDVQLHLHPCWRSFEYGRLTHPINDEIDELSVAQLQTILGDGVDTFLRWGRAVPIAVRMGNLYANKNLYTAMQNQGLYLSSNIGLGVYQPRDSSLHFMNGKHQIGEVIELPVTSFLPMPHLNPKLYRPLQITACSTWEMQSILTRCHQMHMQHVVILTHPFEFIKKRNFRYEDVCRNKLVQGRLQNLIRFVQTHSEQFEFDVFCHIPTNTLEANQCIEGHELLAFERIMENGLDGLAYKCF